MRRGLAQQGLATSRWSKEQKSLRHRMLKALEKMSVQKWQLDRISNCLHRFGLSADARPRNRLYAGQRAVQTLGGSNDLHRYALVGIQAQIQPRLELFFHQQ